MIEGFDLNCDREEPLYLVKLSTFVRDVANGADEQPSHSSTSLVATDDGHDGKLEWSKCARVFLRAFCCF